ARFGLARCRLPANRCQQHLHRAGSAGLVVGEKDSSELRPQVRVEAHVVEGTEVPLFDRRALGGCQIVSVEDSGLVLLEIPAQISVPFEILHQIMGNQGPVDVLQTHDRSSWWAAGFDVISQLTAPIPQRHWSHAVYPSTSQNRSPIAPMTRI